MKFLAALFAFYISCLAAMPCRDSVECNETRAEKFTDHSNHASDEEQCPPFCTCACCGAQIMQITPIVFSAERLSSETPKQRPSFYAFSFPAEVCASIWQPPKIS